MDPIQEIERLRRELENVRAEAVLGMKAAAAAERERCAKLVVEIAEAARRKWISDKSPKQPYVSNRLMHVGWDAAAAIRALPAGGD